MNTPDSQAVVSRFFVALDMLKDRHVIRGVQTFTRSYGINRLNLYSLRKDPSRGLFQVCWLNYLVVEYGVSAEWLLTGKGEPLAENKKG